ncbi:MAG: hypothetical protein D6704_01715 [Nitrospirae bacterium]|nr:MAG: hypothetical protein D6704_01715 [Nitrospirota bacterium]
MNTAPPEVQAILRGVLTDYEKALGSAIEAIVLYGSVARQEYIHGHSNINLLILMPTITREELTLSAQVARRWEPEGVVAPLILTTQELLAIADVFPMEYWEFKEHYRLLKGRDPFINLDVNGERLRMQCEQELWGNLLRLRQRFVEGGARPEAIQVLLSLSLTALIPCVRSIYRLLGQPTSGSTAMILDQLDSCLHVPSTAFHEVWRMKCGQSSPGALELPRLFSRYLEALEIIVARFSELKQQGRL